MNKPTIKQTLIGILVALLAALGGAGASHLGSAQSGLATVTATSSTVSVGQSSVVVLFPSTSAATNGQQNCDSRTITTQGSPIFFTPYEGSATSTATSTLQQSLGWWQAASTTQNYDGGVWGCGAWIVKGGGTATGTIFITEHR